jgi:hypothetical protein
VPVALPVTMGLVVLARMLFATYLVPWVFWRVSRGSRWSFVRGLAPATAVLVLAFVGWVWTRAIQWELAIAASPMNRVGNVVDAPALAAVRMDEVLPAYVCAITLSVWAHLTREEASRGTFARIQWYFVLALASSLFAAWLAIWLDTAISVLG